MPEDSIGQAINKSALGTIINTKTNEEFFTSLAEYMITEYGSLEKSYTFLDFFRFAVGRDAAYLRGEIKEHYTLEEHVQAYKEQMKTVGL